jgi:hypothetical protein
VRAGTALTSHEQPIRHDGVNIAGLQCDLRRLRCSQFGGDTLGGIQCNVPYHVDFPGHRAETRHANPDPRLRFGAEWCNDGGKRRSQKQAPRQPHKVSLANFVRLPPNGGIRSQWPSGTGWHLQFSCFNTIRTPTLIVMVASCIPGVTVRRRRSAIRESGGS